MAKKKQVVNKAAKPFAEWLAQTGLDRAGYAALTYGQRTRLFYLFNKKAAPTRERLLDLEQYKTARNMRGRKAISAGLQSEVLKSYGAPSARGGGLTPETIRAGLGIPQIKPKQVATFTPPTPAPVPGGGDFLDQLTSALELADESAAAAYGRGFASGGGGGGGAGRQPFTAPPFQPISEAEIRPTVEAVIQGSEGRVNPATVSAIVAAWQDLFRKHHEQRVGQARAQYEGAPGGGTIPQVPSPEAFALQEIRTREPIQTGAYDVVKQGEALKRILGIT